MKKIWFITASVVALSATAPAFAADLAARTYTKAPPMMMAAYDWSGFYIGLNGGGGTSHNCWTFVGSTAKAATMPPAALSADRSAIAGRRVRWCSAWKRRATGPISEASNASLLFATSQSNQNRCVRTVYRPGWLYLQQRVALREGRRARLPTTSTTINTLPGALLASATETRWGGVVGVGLEYGFSPNWSVGVEYDHMFMGTSTINFTPAGLPAGADSIKQDVDMFTARINYKFGGPVVARY